MNCNEFERSLDDAVVDRKQPEAVSDLLGEHVAECAACSTRWDEFLLLTEVVPRWNVGFDAATDWDAIDFADSVLFELASEKDRVSSSQSPAPVLQSPPPRVLVGTSRVSPPAPSRKTSSLVAAVCAMALVAVVFVWPNGKPAGESDSATVATNNVGDAQPKDVPPAPPIDELLADAGTAYQFVATDTAEMLTDGASFFRASGISLPAERSPDQANGAPSIADEIPGRLQRIGQSLKPIGHSVSSATGFLFDVLPISETPST